MVIEQFISVINLKPVYFAKTETILYCNTLYNILQPKKIVAHMPKYLFLKRLQTRQLIKYVP